MKKLVSIILALALILALSTTALAAESTTVTVDDIVARTFHAYQIMTLVTSPMLGEHHPDDCTLPHTTEQEFIDNPHKDTCYRYSYSFAENSPYLPILQAETLAYATKNVWGENNAAPTTASAVSEDHIRAYLAEQTSLTMLDVAKRLYDEFVKASITPITITNTAEIEQGYWLFADVTNLSDKHASNSLIIVDTKNDAALTITPKASTPVFEKKVKDIDDTQVGILENAAWVDSADHDIGDNVPFKLTATLASQHQEYNEYKLIFHDTLSKAFSMGTIKHSGLAADNGEEFVVKMYTSKAAADNDANVNDGVDVSTYFTFAPVTQADGSTQITVTCDNVNDIPNVTSTSTFVVYYEAVLNENADFGNPGNPNEAYLEFSNDPYTTQTGKTRTDKVVVFTYQLQIDKVDEKGHALSGAEFTLYKYNSTTKKYDLPVTGTTAENGTRFIWNGLDDGYYQLVESVVPAGYNEMEPIDFTIFANHPESSDNPQLTELSGGVLGTGDVELGQIQKDIINKTGTVLPETGAEGTFFLIAGGALLVMVAAVFMITRKKMSIYED